MIILTLAISIWPWYLLNLECPVTSCFEVNCTIEGDTDLCCEIVSITASNKRSNEMTRKFREMYDQCEFYGTNKLASYSNRDTNSPVP